MKNPPAVAAPDLVPTPAHQGREEHPSSRSRPDEELKAIALQQFASAGFAGTSLQNIADIAGYSKSSVLYHFTSKEALLDAAISPAIDKLARILEGLANHGFGYTRALFVEDFIDFLLEHRLEVHTFINQGQSLRGIPVIDRANSLIVNLSAVLNDEQSTTEERMRFGVALGGAAYTLVAGMTFLGDDIAPEEEIRLALINVVTQLLATIPERPPASANQATSAHSTTTQDD